MATMLLALFTCASLPPNHERRVFTWTSMGTQFRLVLHDTNAARAERAYAAARSEVERLDAQLSDWNHDSELNRLSRCSDGAVPTEWLEVAPDLARVLRAGRQVARASDGAFDPTIGPFVRLWRRSKRQGELPAPAHLAGARGSVGHALLEVHEELDLVRLLAPHMRLDLGGIAKGYAADRALEVLREHGIEFALVDAGGDLRASCPPRGKDAWRVELETPGAPGAVDKVVQFAEGALATSGSTYQFVEIEGTRYSHLVDPHTGLGCTDLRQVNVWAPTGMRADAWASALSVLPVARGLSLVEATPGLEARFSWMNTDGSLDDRESDGFPSCAPIER